jgi:hypothetical protein
MATQLRHHPQTGKFLPKLRVSSSQPKPPPVNGDH